MKKNITIKDFVEALDYKIGEGAEYLWGCYGKNASSLTWTKPDISGSAGIVYDHKDHVVYEMTVWDDLEEKVYRWIRPGYVENHKREAKRRGLSFDLAYDRIKFEDMTPARILNKLKKVYDGTKT